MIRNNNSKKLSQPKSVVTDMDFCILIGPGPPSARCAFAVNLLHRNAHIRNNNCISLTDIVKIF
jgi:hypothetical protein